MAMRHRVSAMPETTESAVLTERRDKILIITINRPEKRNAVNKAVAEGIGDAAELLDSDDTLTLGILTGAGGGFCAGMDLKGFASGETPCTQRADLAASFSSRR